MAAPIPKVNSKRGGAIAPTRLPKPPARIVPGTGGKPIKVAGKAANDPRFVKVMAAIEKSSASVKRHPTAATKAYQAQTAAKAAPNEQAAGAQAAKVDEFKETKAEKPKDSSFLTMLRGEIEKVMPKTNDKADKFMEGGEKEQLKGAVSGNVSAQKNEAAGPLEASSAQPPDASAVPAKEEQPVPTEPNPPAPPVNTGEAMPAPAPAATIEAKANDTKQSADKQMQEAEITDMQMKKANDPRFSNVVTKKDNVKKVATAGVSNYKAGEAKVLTQAVAQSQDAGKQGLSQFTLVKGRGNNAVRARQEAAKARDEARRKEVTTNIENIFNKTKATVDGILNGLEPEVTKLFDSGAEAALNKMKDTSQREIRKFKLIRYVGLGGPALWVYDQFRETLPEIQVILDRNRKIFSADMDVLVVKIANVVEQRLAQAKAEIDRGQGRIKSYVASLPRDLQAVGQAAQQEAQGRFDELRQGVDAKKDELAQKLAERYKAAQDGADAEVKKMEEANKGALSGLVAAIGEVLKMLTEFKNKIMALIRKGQETVKIIVADPIGFLKNLLAAIKGGLNKFISNILTHLKNAFMTWLFGSLAEAGIEIPKDLSLPSILKLVLGVLGITYQRMRAKAVKLIGERNVKIIEKLVEYLQALITGGPAALWEKVKDDLGSLKQMVIDAIQNWLIETLVKKAIAKIVSMFNPVGAIIQAIITIYDVVIFVVEKAKQIMAFVEAIINSVHAIATGAIGGAIDWIEKSLARILPLLIGFLAQLIGLGGISKKIKEFILKIQATVDKAIDKAIAKIVELVKKLFGGGKGGRSGADERTDAQKKQDLKSGISDAEKLLKGAKSTHKKVAQGLPSIKSKYKMTSLELIVKNTVNKKETVYVVAKINPEDKSGDNDIAKEDPDPSREPIINPKGYEITALDPAADAGANLVGLAQWVEGSATITLAIYPKDVTIGGKPATDENRMRGAIILNVLIGAVRKMLKAKVREARASGDKEGATKFQIKGLNGSWNKTSDNTKTFNAVYKAGGTLEQAAWATFTGGQAKSYFKYTKVKDIVTTPKPDDPSIEERRKLGFEKIECTFYK